MVVNSTEHRVLDEVSENVDIIQKFWKLLHTEESHIPRSLEIPESSPSYAPEKSMRKSKAPTKAVFSIKPEHTDLPSS